MKEHKKIFKNFISIIMLICVIFGGIGKTNIARATELEWAAGGFELPVALRGVCVEYVDGKMYVIGGETSKYAFVNTVHIYDFSTKKWSTGTPMSQPRGFSTSNVIDGKIYVTGGYRATTSWYTISDVDIYDIAKNTWSTGTPLPTTNGHTKSVVYKNKIYIFGGVSSVNGKINSIHKTIQIYDPIDNTWTVTDMPFTRYGYTLELIEDKVYLIGGHDGVSYCNDVKIYDLTNKTWSNGTNMINSRHYASSFTYNNKIYVYGGNTGSKLLNSTEIYNFDTDTWSNGTNLLIGKRATNSILVDSKAYLVGGEIDTSATASKSIESLQLPSADNRLFAHLYINEKTQLSFSHNITDNQNLTWKSSDKRVATVDNDGMITALEAGTTYISAYNQNGTYLDYIPVKVTENDVYRMAVHLNSGQKQKLYFKGNPNDILWSSMNSSVASVSENGEVTGISKGLAIAKAEWNGEEHYIYIRVN